MFSSEYCNIFENTFFEKPLPTAGDNRFLTQMALLIADKRKVTYYSWIITPPYCLLFTNRKFENINQKLYIKHINKKPSPSSKAK